MTTSHDSSGELAAAVPAGTTPAPADPTGPDPVLVPTDPETADDVAADPAEPVSPAPVLPFRNDRSMMIPRPAGVGTVVVISTNARRSWAVVDYVRDLAADDVPVEMVVLNSRKWRQLASLRTVRFHHLKRAEERQLVWRMERLLVYRIPGKAVAVADTLLGRAMPSAFARLHHFQRWASGGVHARIFMPPYRLVRAQMLARLLGKRLRGVNFGPVEHIVASDIDSVTLAWRLGRRFPGATVTTSLERRPVLPSLSPGPQG